MTADRTRRRQRRALIARQLAVHRDAADPESAARWQALRWRALDALPDWCALDPSALRELRTIAGVVALSPAVRRCLRGDVIKRLRTLAGPQRLEALRRRPYAVPETSTALDGVTGLEALVAAHGARALAASVEDDDARALLLEALHRDAGSVLPEPTDGAEAIRTDADPEGEGATEADAAAEAPASPEARRAADALVATIAAELRRMAPPADAQAPDPRAPVAQAVGAG